MQRLVAAVLVVMVVVAGGLARAEEDVAALMQQAMDRGLSAAAAASKEDVESMVSAYWGVVLKRSGEAWSLRLQKMMVPLPLVLCHPEDPKPVANLGMSAIGFCAREEQGDLARLVQEAVAKTRKELSADLEALPASPTREQIDKLVFRANQALQRHLRETGWVSRVVDLWDRYVTHASSCADQFVKVAMEQTRGVVTQVVGPNFACDDWTRYLGFCTSNRDEIAEHIMFETGLMPPEDVTRTVNQLREVGLTYCMARIVKEDDPELAAQVLKLRVGSPDMPDKEAINRRAWKLWRRRGVDRWFEEVKREGKVPEKLRLEILQCAGGYLPPVVEGEEKTTAPAGSGEPRVGSGASAPGGPAKR